MCKIKDGRSITHFLSIKIVSTVFDSIDESRQDMGKNLKNQIQIAF